MQKRLMEQIDPSKLIDLAGKITNPVNPMGPEDGLPEIQPNGVIVVKGVQYFVSNRNRYEDDDGWEWFEICLINLETGKRAYLEWEDDDGDWSFSIWTENLTLGDLGVDGKHVDNGKSIKFRGDKYKQDEGGDAYYFPGDSTKRHKYYYYDYEGPDGKLLGIEEWDDDEFEACLGNELEDGDIIVTSLGGE